MIKVVSLLRKLPPWNSDDSLAQAGTFAKSTGFTSDVLRALVESSLHCITSGFIPLL